MLGLKSRMATFHVQRRINQYQPEPLLAILPGVALSQLWHIMEAPENTLRLISVLILIASLLGLSAMLLASIRERQREIELIRVIGASPIYIFFLIEFEALIVCLLSIVLGVGLLYLCLLGVQDALLAHFGVHIQAGMMSEGVGYLLFWVVLSTVIVACIPAASAYKNA